MGADQEGRSKGGCARCGIGSGGGKVQPTALQPAGARPIGLIYMALARCSARRRLVRVFGCRTRTSACTLRAGPGDRRETHRTASRGYKPLLLPAGGAGLNSGLKCLLKLAPAGPCSAEAGTISGSVNWVLRAVGARPAASPLAAQTMRSDQSIMAARLIPALRCARD